MGAAVHDGEADTWRADDRDDGHGDCGQTETGCERQRALSAARAHRTTGVARDNQPEWYPFHAHPLRLLRARAVPEPHLDRSPRLGKVNALVCVASHVTNQRAHMHVHAHRTRTHAHDTQA